MEVISAERPKSQWGLPLTHGGLNVCGLLLTSLANDGTALGGWANSVLSEIHWDKSKITYPVPHGTALKDWLKLMDISRSEITKLLKDKEDSQKELEKKAVEEYGLDTHADAEAASKAKEERSIADNAFFKAIHDLGQASDAYDKALDAHWKQTSMVVESADGRNAINREGAGAGAENTMTKEEEREFVENLKKAGENKALKASQTKAGRRSSSASFHTTEGIATSRETLRSSGGHHAWEGRVLWSTAYNQPYPTRWRSVWERRYG